MRKTRAKRKKQILLLFMEEKVPNTSVQQVSARTALFRADTGHALSTPIVLT